ncbi:imidazolonepropionase-like amidohydrolase [Mucilaginibacter lappiensis]|uniref:Imidazolonepropionase-like amidohydrolase n=1 Tax=Mucilaginibacter lappiensis TaxID=354630 RepID=A0ABR6PSG0_9SPHI|nr:amidohydrolase family protein [Mucilaginibacter lappiensis]MBB6111885.1 imidazolonepropionase-like amidohydrolase [Mucilaginibacter lappiensis]
MNKIYFKSISIILMLFCVISAFAQQTDSVKYIKAGRFIDTEKGRILTNQIIVVDHDTIKAVGDNISIPTGAKVIDLSNATVLPGLIDCHTHLSQQPGDNYYDDIFRKSAVDYAVIAPIYTKRTLLAGFTTCRDVGAAAFIDIALRNAINHGDIPGPRMLCATLFIGSTGSHGDLNGFSPYLDWVGPKQMSGVANGVDEVRKQVRYNIKYGAEVIKFGASAGVLSEEESVGAPQFTQEEMNAIVDEAHLWGLKACAHAHGTIAIKMAVKAGVASIEHGSFLDDEAIALMKQHGTYLVADIYNDDYILSDYAKHGTPEKIINKERLVGKTQRLSFQKAVKAGVKIAFGTDAGVYPHGWNGKQFKYMVKYGLTPMQAIQSATYNAADLLGWQAKVGSIAKGKYADLIAVKTDPLTDITSLENVSFVMKGGEVYKDELHP